MARLALREGKRVQRAYRRRLNSEDGRALQAAVAALSEARRIGEQRAVHRAALALTALLDGPLSWTRKSALREYAEQAAIAIAIALFLRVVFVEAFQIPSASMAPTLEVGDHLFVNKLVYGLRVPFTTNPPRKLWRGAEPEPGEVVVFLYPSQPDNDYIKRVVAAAGDTVRFRGGLLWIRRRGQADFHALPRHFVGRVRYCHFDEANAAWSLREADAFEETLGGKTYRVIGDTRAPRRGFQGALERTRALLPPATRGDVLALGDTFGPIPEGHVFVLGDNRDNSHDGRYFGTVPVDYVTGRASVTWYSRGGLVDERCEVGVRWERTFPRLHRID